VANGQVGGVVSALEDFLVSGQFHTMGDQELELTATQGDFAKLLQIAQELETRLKKTESERDGLVSIIQDKSRIGPGRYQRVVMDAQLYVYNGYKKTPSVLD